MLGNGGIEFLYLVFQPGQSYFQVTRTPRKHACLVTVVDGKRDRVGAYFLDKTQVYPSQGHHGGGIGCPKSPLQSSGSGSSGANEQGQCQHVDYFFLLAGGVCAGELGTQHALGVAEKGKRCLLAQCQRRLCQRDYRTVLGQSDAGYRKGGVNVLLVRANTLAPKESFQTV